MNLKKSNRTLLYLLLVMMIVGSLILTNVLFLMVTHIHFRSGVDVKAFKDPQSQVSVKLAANRGIIYDRSGKEIIAQDVDTYTIQLYVDESRKGIKNTPEYVQDVKMTAEKLAPLLVMEVTEIETYLNNAKKNKLYQTELGPKGKNLKMSVKGEIDKLELPGIDFVKSSQRNYPVGTFASHLIGFSKYDEEQGRIVGQMGLEQSLDSYLRGSDGEEVYQKDVDGNALPGTKYTKTKAVNGNNTILTIDKNTQLALDQALSETMKDAGARKAWAIVMEVETGKILGWSNAPTFDMNVKDIKDYLNVPAQYPYEPGSVMKGITYAAAIDKGVYPKNKTFRSGVFYYAWTPQTGIYRVNGSAGGYPPIREALGKDFGTLSFDKGFIKSSNIGVCELLANYLEPSDYEQYLKDFGFFQPVDIPFIPNEAGVENFERPSDQISMTFGQASSVTALQMVQAYSAIFNDGKMMRPYVVDRIEDAYSHEVVESWSPKVVGEPISKETSEQMRSLMRQVVTDPEGTAHGRYNMPDVEIIAKTGTGQIAGPNGYGTIGSFHTSSVIAAAPADDPKIMIYYSFESSDIINFSGKPFNEAFKQALIANNVSGTSKPEKETYEYSEWQQYIMPSFINHSLTYSEAKYNNMNVKVHVIGDGKQVIQQFPLPETKIHTQGNIFLLTDSTNVTMPNMSGWTRKDVTAFWNLTGIAIEISGDGYVRNQSIAEGTTISKETTIKVNLE